MKKLVKYILYSLLIIFLSLIYFAILNNIKKFSDIEKLYAKRDELLVDIKSTKNKEIFPLFNTNIDTIIKEDYDYLKKNFIKFEYNVNLNKNVGYSILLPRYFDYGINVGKDDPFKITDKDYTIISEFKNKNSDIIGVIYAFNTKLEINATIINNFFVINTFGLSPFKGNAKYYVDNTKSDLLLINPKNGEITRSTAIKNASLYYVLTFTFKNFYHYMKYAKDVSIIFNSFNPKKFSDKLTNIDLNLKKINNYDLLYPKDWNIENKYIKEKKLNKISISPKNNSVIFDIELYENNNKSLKELANDCLEEIKKQNKYIFDGIDEKDIYYDINKGIYSFFLKNVMYKGKIPITIYIEITEQNNKKIVSIMYTCRNEKEHYMYYKQDMRLFNIATNSLKLRLFENVNIEDTDWIKLYYKYNQK